MIRVLRYEVPVDDQPHGFALSGPIVHVAARLPNVVEFWALDSDLAGYDARHFQVYGTGHQIPEGWGHVGSALVGPFVWHLFEKKQ